METTITIDKVEQGTTKSGDTFWKFSTEQGIMSCFNTETAQKLMSHGNTPITVDVQISGKYKNLIGISSNQIPKPAIPGVPQETKGSYPKVSREKLAEGLANQATQLMSLKEYDEELARNTTINLYQFFLEHLNKE